jgi:hypothetical protein
MVKTQVQIEDWQHVAVKKVSAMTSRSMSDLVREGLTLALQRAGRGAVKPISEVAGRHAPLPMDDLNRHDRAWAESIR